MLAIRDIVRDVLASLQTPKPQSQSLKEQWPQIIGEVFAPQTQPFLGRNATLYIRAKHSALAFEIRQRYQASILKRAQALLGEQAIREIKVSVGQLW